MIIDLDINYERESESLGTLAQWLGVQPQSSNLSASRLSDLFCPRFFALRHRFKLVRAGYASARDSGKIAHAMIAALYEGKTKEQARLAGEQEAAHLLDALATSTDGELAQQLVGIEAQLKKDVAMSWAMTNVYWDAYGVTNTAGGRFKVVAVEMKVQFKLPVVDNPISSVVDLVLFDTKTNELWIVDHKTVGYNPLLYQQSVPYDSQSRLYRLAVKAALKEGLLKYTEGENEVVIPPETPITGIVFGVIRRPTITLKKKQTLEQYLEEVKEWYAGTGQHEGTTTGGSNALVAPYPHRFNETWIPLELLGPLCEADDLCRGDPTFAVAPRTSNTGNCRNRYGSPCMYGPLCGQDKRLWSSTVARLFEVEPPREEESESSISL